ncbi:MAG TPA: helix-turn-helix domain-containing protein [Mycobacteriales bacterium]|nr:helix-turn-helix domain-containing protein [Mycobacteriales bacterium]HWC34188.1 helix-turn-helix domain-containing protein [Mycobacteriales bacterium]
MPQPNASQITSTARRVDQVSGLLSTRAMRRMEETLPWFDAMAPLPRSQVGLLVQAGVQGLAAWIRNPKAGATISADVFATAPRELARVISLEQTVQLVRVAVEIVEESVEEFATPAMVPWAREAVLRYSREIAFAAAGVYARAAEQRGAWDARLEALVVDAIVRGDVSDSLRSRASALGWDDPAQVIVMAGAAPSDETERVLTHTRRLGQEAGAEVLTGVQSGRLVVVAGASSRISRIIRALLPAFAEGPVVVGPVAAGLMDAADSVQDVFAALRAVAARPAGPRPVAANDLLPERALAGDTRASRTLINGIYLPLLAEPTLLETADALVDSGGAIEAAARQLYVHANTVRYRTRRVAEISGYDLANARERYVVQTAIALGRMDGTAEKL